MREHLIFQPIAGSLVLSATGTYYRNSSDVFSDQGFFIKANPGNSGNVYLGNTGSGIVDKYPLDSGEDILVNIYNLRSLWFVGTSAGDIVHWLKYGID